MKATIFFGFMFFFLPSSLMKYTITKKVNAIAPKVIALFIQRLSGIKIFSSYFSSMCNPTGQLTAISVTPTEAETTRLKNIDVPIPSSKSFQGILKPIHAVKIRISTPIKWNNRAPLFKITPPLL